MRLTFFDTPVDILTIEETIAVADQAMHGHQPIRHTALNVAKLVNLDRNSELAKDVRTSDLVGIDGKGIEIGLRLFGVKGTKRVAGIDLMMALLEHCALTGRKPYIFGAREDRLCRAIDVARQRFAGLEFAGSRNGYFARCEESEIVEDIARSGADCLFVALPTPRKERFLNRYADQLGVPFIMGVGGSVDVLAGKISRAPDWMQEAGLEWLHRLMREPGKLFWRYARTNTLYGFKLASALLRGHNPVGEI